MEASALRAPVGLGRVSISSPLLRLRSDDQLVALFRSGSEEAFRVIHDRYRQRLFAYTRQMLSGSRSDAEDALQDVFLRAYAALRVDNRPVVLRAWLYRVAHNRCIDQLRRPTPQPSEVFEMSRGPLADPIAQAERREDLRRLVADVRELPEQQRSALLMREMEGLSYADLASALDVSVPAVKSLLVRARVSLVESIEARDTSCVDIRNDIAAAIDRGVRANGRVRRHVRECEGCQDYNTRMRGVQRSFSELAPGHGPFGLIAKLLGIGGAGSGAAAGGTAAGGGAAAVGAGATAVTATKVAAIVCCAAITAGGAVEIGSSTKTSHHHAPAASQSYQVSKATAAAAAAVSHGYATPIKHTSTSTAAVHHSAAIATAAVHHSAPTPVLHPTSHSAPPPVAAPSDAVVPDANTYSGGGVSAPNEDDATTTDDTATDPTTAVTPDPNMPTGTGTAPSASAATAGTPSPTAAPTASAASTGSPTAGTSGSPTTTTTSAPVASVATASTPTATP
jgi:RNA polymerase sigma factor (sigma-70 family)